MCVWNTRIIPQVGSGHCNTRIIHVTRARARTPHTRERAHTHTHTYAHRHARAHAQGKQYQPDMLRVGSPTVCSARIRVVTLDYQARPACTACHVPHDVAQRRCTRFHTCPRNFEGEGGRERAPAGCRAGALSLSPPPLPLSLSLSLEFSVSLFFSCSLSLPSPSALARSLLLLLSFSLSLFLTLFLIFSPRSPPLSLMRTEWRGP